MKPLVLTLVAMVYWHKVSFMEFARRAVKSMTFATLESDEKAVLMFVRNHRHSGWSVAELSPEHIMTTVMVGM